MNLPRFRITIGWMMAAIVVVAVVMTTFLRLPEFVYLALAMAFPAGFILAPLLLIGTIVKRTQPGHSRRRWLMLLAVFPEALLSLASIVPASVIADSLLDFNDPNESSRIKNTIDIGMYFVATPFLRMLFLSPLYIIRYKFVGKNEY